MESALSALAAAAGPALLRAWHPGGVCVPLPRYPWRRRRFWVDEATAVPAPAAVAVPGPPPVAASPASLAAGGLEPYLRERIAWLLGQPASSLDCAAPLNGLGFDSLMAWQLKAELEAKLKVSIAAKDLLGGVSVGQLAERLKGG
jgi:acyl carrier protein